MVGLLAALALGLAGLRWLITPDLSRERIRTDVAQVGPVEATVQASGTVVPRAEEQLPSPIASRVLSIERRPGDRVRRGDLILKLDAASTELELAQTRSEIALKQSARNKRRLNLRDQQSALLAANELKRIDLESQRAKLSRLERLAGDALVSQEELQEARLDIRRSEAEIRHNDAAVSNLAETAQAELAEIEAELSVLRTRLEQQRRTLERASARATRDGVLTFVIDEIGTSVGVGETLARIADLGAYRVDATLSDAYAARLQEGQAARVRVDERMLQGRLSTILPTIDNGSLTVQVALDQPAAEGLRVNLRVDVFLVTDRREQAVTLARGPAINGSGRQAIFVVVDGEARRREAEFGLASFDRWEVLSGVEAGEEVITSDTADFRHRSSIAIHD